MIVSFAHARDAGAARRKIQGVIGQIRPRVRVHVAPMRKEPLFQLHAHSGLDRRPLRARLHAPDQIQPREPLVMQIVRHQ